MDCRSCKEPVDEEKGGWVATIDTVTGVTKDMEHPACEGVRAREEFQKTGYITSSLWLDANLKVLRASRDKEAKLVDYEINDAVERVRVDVKRFETEVWFGGAATTTEVHKWHGKRLVYPRVPGSLQSVVEDHKYSTLTDRLMGIEVTTQCMAGRVGIELEDLGGARARITLVAAEHEQSPRMGIMGLNGTEDDFRRMINCVREGWKYLNLKPKKGR